VLGKHYLGCYDQRALTPSILLAGQHTVRGATKEKSRKLDELKAKRKAKDDKKVMPLCRCSPDVRCLFLCGQTKGPGGSSPKRARSSSPDDMEMSSEEEEDGQISRLELEEERDRRLYGRPDAEDEKLTLEDLMKCRLSRDMIAKACMAPWFEDYVKGKCGPCSMLSIGLRFYRRLCTLSHWQ
jgi:RNA polymerase-associated protein RTF1